jgi:hypothetical protein
MLIVQPTQHSDLPFDPVIFLLVLPIQPDLFDRIYILIDFMSR